MIASRKTSSPSSAASMVVSRSCSRLFSTTNSHISDKFSTEPPKTDEPDNRRQPGGNAGQPRAPRPDHAAELTERFAIQDFLRLSDRLEVSQVAVKLIHDRIALGAGGDAFLLLRPGHVDL